jgi:hypothetical protein
VQARRVELLETSKVPYLRDLKGGRKKLVRSGLDTSRVDEQIRRAQAEHDPDSSTGKWIMQFHVSE